MISWLILTSIVIIITIYALCLYENIEFTHFVLAFYLILIDSYYIKLIGFRLEIINKCLIVIHLNHNRLNIEQSEDEIYDNIVTLRRNYHILWEYSMNVKLFCQFTNFICMEC